MNKFFNVNDKAINDMDGFKIPSEWWSRPYEYQFAIEQLSETDVILDAGCGIDHPFKDYARKRVKKVYAVDNDNKIKEKVNTDKIEYIHEELQNIDKQFEDKFFDKIFCISVIEHTSENFVTILEQFKKVLKDDGTIVLTMDYPFLYPTDLVKIIEKIGLEFVGEVNYTLDEEIVIKGQYQGLRCFSALLKKKE